MRVSVYLVVAVLVAAVNCENGAEFYGKYLEPVNVEADQETIRYLLPKLTEKYRPSGEWSGVTDPRFYVLTDMESNDNDNQGPSVLKKLRNKRFDAKKRISDVASNSPDQFRNTISVQAPIETLRNMYKMEMFRKKMRMNRLFLENLQNDQ